MLPRSPFETAGPAPSERRSLEDLRMLYDLHAGEIFRFCQRLVGDRGLAEEAMQETFLRAWRASSTWDPTSGSLRTWLYAIARNTSIDLLRARARRLPLSNGTEAETSSDEVGYESVVSSWMLEEAMNRLPEDQRNAVLLTYVQDRPYAETAALLGVPEGTLRTRVFYGLKALRKVLEEMGWHE